MQVRVWVQVRVRALVQARVRVRLQVQTRPGPRPVEKSDEKYATKASLGLLISFGSSLHAGKDLFPAYLVLLNTFVGFDVETQCLCRDWSLRPSSLRITGICCSAVLVGVRLPAAFGVLCRTPAPSSV